MLLMSNLNLMKNYGWNNWNKFQRLNSVVEKLFVISNNKCKYVSKSFKGIEYLQNFNESGI